MTISAAAQVVTNLYVFRMHKPLLQVNSFAVQDLRVQFWCSSNASLQSASPSQTHARGMHLRSGGRLLAHVNSAAVQLRFAGRRASSLTCHVILRACKTLSLRTHTQPGYPHLIPNTASSAAHAHCSQVQNSYSFPLIFTEHCSSGTLTASQSTLEFLSQCWHVQNSGSCCILSTSFSCSWPQLSVPCFLQGIPSSGLVNRLFFVRPLNSHTCFAHSFLQKLRQNHVVINMHKR